MTNGLTRPQQIDVVPVDVAASELAAVRALLEELGDEVDLAERAAVEAEQGGAVADARSRDAVERLAATRRAELRAAEADARRIAAEQVLEATRRAHALAEASRREAAELLRERVSRSEQLARVPEPEVVPEPPSGLAPTLRAEPTVAAPEPLADLGAEVPTAAAPALSGWTAAPAAVDAAAAATAVHPEVATASAAWTAPESVAAQRAHAQFWSEADEAAQERRAQKLAAPFAPIEALLPTIALVILLLAVLLLIG